MFVLAKSKSETEVGKALDLLVEEINLELEKIGGKISKIDCDVTVGPIEASVSVSLFIEGDEPIKKTIFGVNEKGYNRETSMKKAQKDINTLIKNNGGMVAGTFTKIISHLPGRVYTTIIMAVNGEVITGVKGVDAEIRRERIKKALELFGGDPAVLNVAQLASQFGISRTMIYKDLEALGYKRNQ